MTYPYYIVQWKVGRIPCPAEYRHTPIEREFTSGRIGGRNVKEERTTDAKAAYELWNKDRLNRTIYVVNRDRPRQMVNPQTLRDV